MIDISETFITVPVENNISFTKADSDCILSEITGSDPLAGLAAANNETKYYRLDISVFAEPLDPSIMEETTYNENKEEITFVGNVTVQKRAGKRTKYHIDIDPSKPVCPQPNCQRKFTNTTLLKAHIRNVHCADRGRFPCTACPNTYSAKYLLARHTAVHEKRTVECPVCGCLLSERSSMAAHLRTHSRATPHACASCGARFGRASARNRHSTTCRGQSKRPTSVDH